jgi:methylated-DNA-[protein]-cysteine S-methyltransferase
MAGHQRDPNPKIYVPNVIHQRHISQEAVPVARRARAPCGPDGDCERTAFEEEVYSITSRIPQGKVSTYSDVAAALGNPGLARAVGNALGRNPYSHVPCYRVVRSDGRVGGYSSVHGPKLKIEKLRSDGLDIRGGRIMGLEDYLVSHEDLEAMGARKRRRKKGGEPDRKRAGWRI